MTDKLPKPGRRGFLGILASAPVAAPVIFTAAPAAVPIDKMVAADVAPVEAVKRFARMARSVMDGSASWMCMVTASFATGETKPWFSTGSASYASDEEDDEYEADREEGDDE